MLSLTSKLSLIFFSELDYLKQSDSREKKAFTEFSLKRNISIQLECGFSQALKLHIQARCKARALVLLNVINYFSNLPQILHPLLKVANGIKSHAAFCAKFMFSAITNNNNNKSASRLSRKSTFNYMALTRWKR